MVIVIKERFWLVSGFGVLRKGFRVKVTLLLPDLSGFHPDLSSLLSFSLSVSLFTLSSSTGGNDDKDK